MMASKDATNIYAECKDIKRLKPDVEITEEVAKEIGSNYRALPMFEKGLFEYINTKYYSLQRNELLKCRWKKYKQNIEGRVFAPFQFPCIRDLHFYNGSIRFRPSESIYKRPDLRMKLKPGPGVDYGGQMPIPQELHMKRGISESKNIVKDKIKKSK